MSAPRFSVLIVNFNSGHYLADALASLRRQTFRNFEVIVLDNDSSDGSADEISGDGLPSLKVMLETDNHGFARGNNIAARTASGEWLVLLNPDAVAEPDWLAEIDAAIAQHPGVHMFASCQYALDAPGRLDGVGDAYLAYGFPWRGGYGQNVDLVPEKGEVFGPCGASAVYKADCFKEVGGFDERFFCYCEDVDLAFKLRLAGEVCAFLPSAVVHHAGSAITGRMSDFTLFHGTRNRIWVYFQNMPSVWFWLTLPGHVALTLYLVVRAWMTQRGLIITRAMSEGYGLAFNLRRRAGRLRKRRKIGLLSLGRIMAWNPFAMSRHQPYVQPLRAPIERQRPERSRRDN